MEGLLDKKPRSSHGSGSGSGQGSSPISEEEFKFPMKPVARNMGAAVRVVSNFYPMKVKDQRTVIYEYQVKTVPLLTCHSYKEKGLLRSIVNDKSNRDELEGIFDSFIYFEGYLYSFEKVEDTSLPTQTKTKDDVEYTISYEFHREHDFNCKGATFFFRAFLNKLIKEVGFKQVRGGKHFDPKSALELQGVNMYSAFFNTMKAVDGKIYLNLNPSVKFF